MPHPVLIGLAVGVAIASLARAAGALTASGAVAASLVGMAAFVAGPAFVGALLAFFVLSQALTHWRAARKAERTAAIIEKGGPRDAWQVAANGGVFAAAACAAFVSPAPAWGAAALGAIAAATADTWGTEVGTAAAGTPRSVRGWRPVPTGTSGAVSAVGTIASVIGAVVVGAVCYGLGVHMKVTAAAVIGGVTGALVDTLLGATIQDVRRCDRCAAETERRVHRCGTATQHLRGWSWMTNDVVNLTSTLAGAVVAAGAVQV